MKFQGIAIAVLSLLAFAPLTGKAQTAFAYAANSGSPSNISGYSLNVGTGALTPLPGSPFGSGGLDTNWIVIHPSGLFLYTTNENSNNIVGFVINRLTGALTPIAGSPFTTGRGPNNPRLTPSGRFLYVGNENDSTISGFSVDPSTGALTPIAGSPFTALGLTDSIAIDPSGRFLYATDNAFPGFVLAFTINASTGALTPIGGSPFAAGNEPDTLFVDPSGRFLYVGNFVDQTVGGYSIDPVTGALTPIVGSPFAAGGTPDEVTVDPSGKFLYTANDASGTPGVGAFTIDPVTGALTAVAGSPFTAGSAPSGVRVDFTGKFLYAANENSNNISGFRIDPVTGALTPVIGGPFTAGAEPVKIATVGFPVGDFYQLRYLANLDKADSYVNATNAGTLSGIDPDGRICANFYVFDPAEELVSCCSCLITPNGLVSLSARNDLTFKTLTGAALTSGITVKVLATTPTAAGTCNASTPSTTTLIGGLRLWAITPHLNTDVTAPDPPGTPVIPQYQLGETEFARAELSDSELAKLAGFCRFIQVNASTFGQCKSCPFPGNGAQGAVIK